MPARSRVPNSSPTRSAAWARYRTPPGWHPRVLFSARWSLSHCVRYSGRVDKVNLAEKLAQFGEHWQPKIVGELNGQHVKVVKFSGPFVWHHHAEEDEMFLVIKGSFVMEFRDRSVVLNEGEFLIVPRGVEHRPVAESEVHVLLFEPAGTRNTGNIESDRTAPTAYL